MLARHDCAPHAFLPHVPSPLSPRSANIYGVRSSTPSSFYMSGENAVSEGRKWVSEQPPVVGFTTKPKREVRRAKVPGQDELTKRRRALFLRKVGEGREERRWESRGEDIMRLDFMQRQKAWEAERAREARLVGSEDIEVEDVEDTLPGEGHAMLLPDLSSQQSVREEVDEVAQLEQRELEALLEYMPNATMQDEDKDDARSEHLWSDDDEYDAIFSELEEHESLASHGGQESAAPQHAPEDDEMMDLS
ncbi:hypothetical protein B0A50_07475 [Salinomyces thailandicus]|uniref:Uncharacterized protein n=1 Tax=Salinomyces thailandicus TaxID=706561 RepID=A0A4U0TN79_9PEZI|nr:hypothetical protein B0A50_07475 [Salinomyces thailandica]